MHLGWWLASELYRLSARLGIGPAYGASMPNHAKQKDYWLLPLVFVNCQHRVEEGARSLTAVTKVS